MGHGQWLGQVGHHPVPLELPVCAIIQHELEAVVHHFKFTQGSVMGPQSGGALVDDCLSGFGTQVVHPFPDLFIRQVGVAVEQRRGQFLFALPVPVDQPHFRRSHPRHRAFCCRLFTGKARPAGLVQLDA